MKRAHADILLGFVGLIWGFGFVAQKDALNYIGPATFIACKFLISAIFVLPFLTKELRKSNTIAAIKNSGYGVFALCFVFAVAVLAQQYGMKATSVTKAAFITGLYVVLVPFCGFILYRHKITAIVLIACLLSFIGVVLLTGGDTSELMGNFTWGDGLILVCAVFFALQVSIMGYVVNATKMPFLLSFLQYLAAGLAGLILAAMTETIDVYAIGDAWLPILYSGIASGGIAYTLQAVAQQHTPSADCAIILTTESLFGGVGGVWLMHDPVTTQIIVGCAVIMLAIVLVELVPSSQKKTA